MKNFVYHTSRTCFASIRTYNIRLSTRTANRTHARKRAVSGLVIQIAIISECAQYAAIYYVIKND
jgi:ADP-ribosylglycohydrolase